MPHRMQTLSRRAAIGATVALALSSAPALAAGGGKKLTGATFRTTAPSGWSVKAKAKSGEHLFALASPGAKVDGVGVPSAGGVGITILEHRASLLAKQLKRKSLPSSPVAVFDAVVGTPTAATGVQPSGAVTRTTYEGSPAAKGAFTYTYQQRTIVQTDLVVLRKGRVFFLEADTDSAQAAAGATALAHVKSAWRWR
ncbi:MAG: hypothetical protein JWQ18_2528 [Conexibacter sp.]|nr:hypothetical protein [Conexibacter sp.]